MRIKFALGAEEQGAGRRPNKRLNATAHSAAFMWLARGGALPAALDLWARVNVSEILDGGNM